jgi:hypothetical protein
MYLLLTRPVYIEVGTPRTGPRELLLLIHFPQDDGVSVYTANAQWGPTQHREMWSMRPIE